MKKYFLLFTASFLAFEACFIASSQFTHAMEESKQEEMAPSITSVKLRDDSLDTKKRMYTPPFLPPALSKKQNLYESASSIFDKHIRVDVSSVQELRLWKSDPFKGDLIARKNFQDTLKYALENTINHYAGQLSDFMTPKKEIQKDLRILIEAINFEEFDPSGRMLYWQYMVKSGCFKAVKKLTQVLMEIKSEELFNYNKILTEACFAQSHVPIFWLPAIVTRWDEETVPDKSYQDIEKYLCNIFCPSGKAIIMDQEVDRNQFVEEVNKWKISENKRLGKDRYQLPLSFVSTLNK
ncbi:MAG: hypothetical protein BGO67_05620 [Alphaproteobacteria bacterium 41-28]|nr:MAG: hypothetical protein BGO67_05620 [Alphaproteobacteria bacterium 41-28]